MAHYHFNGKTDDNATSNPDQISLPISSKTSNECSHDVFPPIFSAI